MYYIRHITPLKGKDGYVQFGETSTLPGLTEGVWDAVSPQRRSRGRHGFVIAAGGGQEPGRVTVGCPVGS